MAETITQYLLSRHYSIESVVNLKFSYSVGDPKVISVRLGDEVTVTYVDSSGTLKKVTGIITDIINKKVNGATSFKSNEQMGNGNYELQFRIDASTENNSQVVSIYLIDIYDMILGSEPENYTVSGIVTEGILDKPSQMVVANSSATVNFTPNENKVLKVISVGADTYTFTDGVPDPEIPEGLSVTVTDTLVTVTIDIVTSDITIAAVFGDAGVEPTKYLVHGSVVGNGSVDLTEQEVVEGSNASITLTVDENNKLTKIDVDGTDSYVYDGATFTPELPSDITFADGVLTISNVTGERYVVFTVEEVTPVVTKYFVTASATNATVDQASQEVEEGTSATITVTPDANAVFESVTINSTEYTKDTIPAEYTFEQNVFTITSVTEALLIEFKYTISKEPVKHTVTASGTNATVDPASQEVEDGNTATITATVADTAQLSNIKIDGTEYVDVNALPANITYVGNVLTITNVTADMTVEINYDVTPSVNTYTVITNAVKGTVDHDSLTVNENDNAVVVITPDVDTELKSVTIDSVDYTYDGSNFTPELPAKITITVSSNVTFAIDDVTADHTANFTFDDIPPVTHTLSASAVKGTVDKDSQDVVEGQDGAVTVTPDPSTVLKSVKYTTDTTTEYVYDASTTSFTPALDTSVLDVNVGIDSIIVNVKNMTTDVTVEVTLEDLP